MRKIAAISGFTFAALLILSCGSWASVSAQVQKHAATRFDEFGQIGHCDLGARLDNFAIQVQNTPDSQANIISYGPEGEGPGTGRYSLEIVKDYLVNTRGLGPNRVKTIYGGRNTDLTQPAIELWIVPTGAASPEPQKRESYLERIQGLFAERPAFDGFGLYHEEEMGPGIPGTTDAAFADTLNVQKNATGYLVVYSGKDGMPGEWRRIAQSKIDSLKALKLEANRLKMIFGGHREKTRLQLWVSPDGSPPPIPDAGPELSPTKAVRVSDFYSYSLRNKRNQTAIFRRLAEVLRLDDTVTVFLVVHLKQLVPEEEPSEDSEPEPSEETKPLDLTKLVEKWRLELANTHKIGGERFIVMSAPARENEATKLTLWIVPKGQPLPDPNESEEDTEKRP